MADVEDSSLEPLLYSIGFPDLKTIGEIDKGNLVFLG